MQRGDSGYTVLEALVAFAILSVVLVSLYGAGGTSLLGVDRATRLQSVALLAQSKLDEIAATRALLPESSRGAFANSDVSWKIDAQPALRSQNDTSPLRLQDVHLVMTWSEGTRTETFDLRTRHLGTVRQ